MNKKIKNKFKTKKKPEKQESAWRKLFYKTTELDPFPIMRLFRIAFYLLMALEWTRLLHGPYNQWQQSLFYYDFRSLAGALTPTTSLGSNIIFYSGIIAALGSIRSRFSSIIFALCFIHNLCIGITHFNNHDYLFVLISVLLAGYANTNSKKTKKLYIEVLRAQVVVVYFYASLWKITPGWFDGTICKGIFLSFEEQGVARGIPWKSIYQTLPNVFQLIAIFGFVLDFILFFTLMFFPLGSRAQLAALLFHGFTSVTMSMRIGYTFPLVMIASALLFQRMDNEEKENHFSKVKKLFKMKPIPIVFLSWIILQWLIPARMPIVSKGEFKYTMEGYRYSWTMMLHSKSNFIVPGMFFADLLPSCNGSPFPSPLKESFLNPQAFPYVRLIGERGWAGLSMYTRQFPSIANSIRSAVSVMCPPENISIRGSVFSSVDEGSFVRLVDPSIDLTRTYDALKDRSWFTSMTQSFLDKVPEDNEFILRKMGSIEVEKQKNWHTFIDRSPCLKIDPLKFFDVSVAVRVDQTPVELAIRSCSTTLESSCRVEPLSSIPVVVKKSQMISIMIKDSLGPGSCRGSKEDIVISVKVLDARGK